MQLTNPHKLNESGLVRQFIVFGTVLVLIFGIFNTYKLVSGQSVSGHPEIRSGMFGYCLDDHHDGKGVNTTVDTWTCNGTDSQAWTVDGSSIKLDKGGCLDIDGSKIVMNNCNGSPGQVWTIDQGGFQNPGSGKCLSLPGKKLNQQLIINSCNNLDDQAETWAAGSWTPTDASTPPCTGSEGQRVACYAQQQWVAWQAGAISHKTLLADYTDGNGYEQWCADFVSYVYKEAGYPFANGERDGWDEYDANNIQNMGFTMHPADGYTPQPGDVAFFDYPGGHVEIVVTGGPHPTFIYGDSGTTDPVTGQGEMNEDTLTSDGSAGQVSYYLSPL